MIGNDFWHNRRVLITGGTGFIGSSLITALIDRKADITSFERDSKINREHHFDSKLVEVFTGNLNDKKTVITAIQQQQPSIIFHLAGEAIQSDDKDYAANTEGTRNILEAIRLHSPQSALVFTSSDSVYGLGLPEAFTENSKPAPQTPYAKSKHQAETLIQNYSEQYGLSCAIARMSNVYGQGDLNFSHLIPGQIKNIQSGKQPSLNSNGRSVCDFIYIDDIIDGLILIASDLLINRHCCETFNLSTGVSTSVIDTLKKLLTLMRREDLIPVLNQSMQKNDILRQSSPKKMNTMLGWNALIDLSTGLKLSIEWYKNKTFS